MLIATHLGTPGDDVLLGTNGPDVIVGLGGDDKLKGFGAKADKAKTCEVEKAI